MSSENSQQRAAWRVAFGQIPQKGSRSLYQSLNFALENPVNISLVYETESDRLEFVQSIYVDNSQNPCALVCNFKTTNQTITIPGGAQAYLPVLASADNPKVSFLTSFGTGLPPTVYVQFLSFPVALDIWQASTGSVGTNHSANAPALLANLLATAPVNGARSNIEVQNQSADTIQVVRDDGAGGNLSIILLAAGAQANAQGGAWISSYFKGRVRIFAPSANDQVAMYED